MVNPSSCKDTFTYRNFIILFYWSREALKRYTQIFFPFGLKRGYRRAKFHSQFVPDYDNIFLFESLDWWGEERITRCGTHFNNNHRIIHLSLGSSPNPGYLSSSPIGPWSINPSTHNPFLYLVNNTQPSSPYPVDTLFRGSGIQTNASYCQNHHHGTPKTKSNTRNSNITSHFIIYRSRRRRIQAPLVLLCER